ncbi:MAG: SPOR domain-containing protein [Candidatus Sulfotelmatobacter sp.]|jgi:cell division septation protein DedD
MASSEDTEITLGTAKLLGLFFGLVMICAVFFALGYTLGRKADAGLVTASAMTPVPTASNGSKPAGAATGTSATPMTFYKAVEQQNANPQLTPAATDAGTAAAGAAAPTSAGQAGAASPGGSSSQAQVAPAGNPPDPLAVLPGTGYFVQVAAVSKQDDAEALVDALKKKQYPAFVANSSATDKLFRVQVGPFADIKDAEAMRTRLVSDGYNPILKK